MFGSTLDSADVRAVVPVVSDPLGLITASGQVWTQNFGDGTLSRIDPVTSRATSQLQEVVGAASDGEDLWVAVDGNRLVRIDGATGQWEASFRLGRTALFVPRDAGFLAVGHGSIWLTVPKLGDSGAPRELWRIDPRTRTVRAKIGYRNTDWARDLTL